VENVFKVQESAVTICHQHVEEIEITMQCSTASRLSMVLWFEVNAGITCQPLQLIRMRPCQDFALRQAVAQGGQTS